MRRCRRSWRIHASARAAGARRTSIHEPLTDYANGLRLVLVEFEWDPAKDRSNRRKHGLSFDEAQRLFESGVDYLEIFDADHSELEDRFIAIGPVARGIVVVVYTESEEGRVRIIGSRRATKREQDLYRAHTGRTR